MDDFRFDFWLLHDCYDKTHTYTHADKTDRRTERDKQIPNDREIWRGKKDKLMKGNERKKRKKY